MTILRRTLTLIAIVQAVLGVMLLVPGLPARLLGLASAPDWVNWLFAMFGARAIGFAYGMALAARNPLRHMSWIRAMIGIQAIDWIGTVAYLVTGAVTFAQVTTAAFLPLVFIVILSRYSPVVPGAESPVDALAGQPA